MMRRIRARMTYANVAATLALVLAMSGGAFAATRYLITSPKQISPKVLKELKKAGPQGPAGPAGAAGAAGANGAAGAKGEQGPQGVQGAPGEIGPTSLPAAVWNKTVETAGASKASPKVVELDKVGPFKITGHCYLNGANTVAMTYIESSEEGAVFAGTGGEEEEIEKGVPIPVTAIGGEAESATAAHETAFTGPSEGPFAAQNKAGNIALNGSANQGVFLGSKASPACFFSGTATEEK